MMDKPKDYICPECGEYDGCQKGCSNRKELKSLNEWAVELGYDVSNLKTFDIPKSISKNDAEKIWQLIVLIEIYGRCPK